MLIGVFHPMNPFEVMPHDRIQALIAEAATQQVQLIFFDESGIQLEKRTVSGVVPVSGSWEAATLPFPQAIMNIRPWSPRKRSSVELIFRKMVPFSAFLIDNKWEITNLLAASPELNEYIVPTTVLSDIETIDQLFLQHSKLIIKPAQGSRGEGVQGLIREGEFYSLQRGSEWIRMTRENLLTFILGLGKQYLLQPYIVCLTPDGEPFDFRILAQRDGKGQWVISLIYPRIGQRETITSNVSVGGRTEDMLPFLSRLFADQAHTMPKLLHDLGLTIAEAVNSHYPFDLNELGIDLAIDQQQRIWFYEANTCPGTLFYEKERAVLAISYVKYIAESRLPELTISSTAPNRKKVIGLLVESSKENHDLDAYADVASSYQVQLVYFRLEDIRTRTETISGYWRDGLQWISRHFAFPDIVYNMAELKNSSDIKKLYSRKSNLVLTSNEPPGPIPASLFYAVASRDALLAASLPLYLNPDSIEEAKQFIDQCHTVIMKSDTASDLSEIIMIRRLPTHYEVKDHSFLHQLSEQEFLAFLSLFEEKEYTLVEQIDSRTTDGYFLHLQLFLMKDANGLWIPMKAAPILVLNTDIQEESMPLAVDWEWLLYEEFAELPGMETDVLVRELACTLAVKLEQASYTRFHELIIDFAIDPHQQFKLLGAEIKGAGEAVHPYEIARHVIPYSLSLLHRE